MKITGKERGQPGLSRRETEDRPTVKKKRLTLDIPEDFHRAIKLDAVHAGVTMVDRLRVLLLKHYRLAAGSRQETTT